MRPELGAWTGMREAIMRFDPVAHLCRIENGVGPGMPDVNGCIKGIEFWAELKGIPKWPGEPDGICRLKHGLLDSQRTWIHRRILAGGQVWVILGVRTRTPEWLIWDGLTAIEVLNHVSKEQLYQSAAIHSIGTFPTEQFFGNLTVGGAGRGL